jgi:hypothetical protein
MKVIGILAAAGAAAALLSACSGGAHGAPGAGGGAPAAAQSAPAPTAPTSGSGSLPSGPLSLKQAEPVYRAIIGPGNSIANALVRDSAPNTSFRQFRSDALAYARELNAEIGKFRAVHWPAQVKPHISTMIEHDFPADISCLQAEAAAGNPKAAQQVANTSHDCMIADNANIPSTLQSMLAR